MERDGPRDGPRGGPRGGLSLQQRSRNMWTQSDQILTVPDRDPAIVTPAATSSCCDAHASFLLHR